MTTVDGAAKATPVEPPWPKHVRNAVIDRIVAGRMNGPLTKSPDIADLILADLERMGFGDLWRHALPAVRTLQRLASTEWIITQTGDDRRDQMAETRARAELARITLAGMGIPWRRRT
jgi:hypothetical protein